MSTRDKTAAEAEAEAPTAEAEAPAEEVLDPSAEAEKRRLAYDAAAKEAAAEAEKAASA